MASSIIYQALSFVLVSLLLLPLARSATAPLRVCDVTAYGAVGDNATEATAAVQRAVADCAGGGTVLLPAPGIFLLRPVQLFSGVELRIEGTVAAWRNRTTWPNSTFQVCPCSPYETPDPVLAPQKESLFFAHNASDISITGSGVIDGKNEEEGTAGLSIGNIETVYEQEKNEERMAGLSIGNIETVYEQERYKR